ncbi:hypothetical protein ACEWY4_011566 [Coilia grayii]|uniref:Leucine-rich repeat-containing protein 43 n=1 Tax=Coilia grayii TaxID=363190 RepID=A0ABD1JY23_9TELE
MGKEVALSGFPSVPPPGGLTRKATNHQCRPCHICNLSPCQPQRLSNARSSTLPKYPVLLSHASRQLNTCPHTLLGVDQFTRNLMWGSASQESSDREGDTEEPAALIDLLTCLQSPWRYEGSWSAQAAALRELSVRKPECLSDAFVYTFFTSLRVVGQRVSVIDEGLLRFCKLEELVLCVNCISDIPLKHFPATLQVLELYANEISSLRGASGQQLPNLRHLGLGRNPLGSLEDLKYISSSIWPQLVSLDLSGCGFASLGGVLGGVASLAGLRVLSLEGNPLVLSPAYPGVLIDGLPRLLYLDGTRVTPDDRSAFRGMAAIKGLALDEAVVQVSVGPIRGVAPPPVPPRAGSFDFPLVSYNYRISYHFLTNQWLSFAVYSETKLGFGTIRLGHRGSRNWQQPSRWRNASWDDYCQHVRWPKRSSDVNE